MKLMPKSIYESRNRSLHSIAFVLLFELVAFSGCRTTLKTAGPYLSSDLTVPREGLRYHLAKDQLIVKATVKTRKERHVAQDLSIPPSTTSFVSSEGQVELRTVADHSMCFRMDMEPGAISDDLISVDVDQGGVLRSVNATSIGRTGEIVGNVTKFLATVAPVAGMLAEGRDVDEVFKEITKEKQLEDLPKEVRDREWEKFKEVPPEVILFLKTSKTAKDLWGSRIRLGWTIDTLQTERLKLQKTIPNTADDKMISLQGRIDLLGKNMDSLKKEQETVNAAFDAQLLQFKRKHEIGSTEYTRSIERVLDLTDLPPTGTVEPGLPDTSVREKLQQKYPKALDLYDEAKLVLTASPLVGEETPEQGKKACTPSDPEKDKKLARIYYRQACPVTISSYVLRTTAEKDELTHNSDEVKYVMHPEAPLLYVSFSTNAFAKRELALKFDERGSIVNLKRDTTSSAAAASSALAGSATTAVETLASSSEKVVQIQERYRKIELDPLLSEIGNLKEEKSLIDARLALEGSTASYDLLLEKQKIDDEIKNLTSKLALAEIQSKMEISESVEKLKMDVDLLKRELELLQVRQEMEKLRQEMK